MPNEELRKELAESKDVGASDKKLESEESEELSEESNELLDDFFAQVQLS